MILSLCLLVVFQAYWLRKTYRDEFGSLRRELNVLLRETTIRQQMMASMADSGLKFRKANDSAKLPITNRIIIQGATPSNEPAAVRWQMNMKTKGDSATKQGASVVVTGFPMGPIGRRDFRDENFQTDELVVWIPLMERNTQSNWLSMLDSSYRKALKENYIRLQYVLQPMSPSRFDSLQRRDSARMNVYIRRGFPLQDFTMIEARFENPFWLLVYHMRWSVAFSLIMLSITTLAFLFLYKNLQTQQRLALLKSDFISNITHELKTPIATVGVAIEALRNFDAIHNPDRTREYLDISASELQRLSMLVDKVLRLSMFEQNKMELTKEPVDLKELVQEVMQSMKLQFEKRNAVVEFTPSNTDAMVLGDKLHLLSVVYNLLDNAMKYSAEKPWIQIAIYQQDSGLQLRVKDNGIGIAPEYRLKVFDKFFRVPHGNTHNVKGYGLGLSYVHEVIQKHGGTIVVQAAEPNGSEFIMNLPVYNLPS